jgi:predicted PurR-regulated permease PerM
MSSFAVVVVLTGFILVSRQPFLSLATMFFVRPSEKLHAARIWTRVEDQVSRYFLTITAINIALGIIVGTMLALYGMPYATLWGVLVTLFNFIPFVGPAIGMIILAAVSLVTFDSVWVAAVPPLIYFGINFIEANVVTPQAIGQHLRISPVAILVSLMFWGWIWGFAGLLISVPFLVVLKSIADQTPRLAMINRIVSRRSNLRTSS